MKTINLSIVGGMVLMFLGICHADTREYLSPVYTIDKKYKSMEGPQSTASVTILENQPAQLVWVTGFKTEMVGEDGKTPSQPQFMCHVNLDFDPEKHRQLFDWQKNVNSRLLTLSQGAVDVEFPKGFGLPLVSNEMLSLTTQVLNLNLDHPNNLKVRHKVTITYVKDSDLKTPMKPLFNTSAFGMKVIEGVDGRFDQAPNSSSMSGMAGMDHASCLPGSTAPNASGGSTYGDHFGRSFTGHWVVKPGREENHTDVTEQMNLPFDTTLHYVAVHLHPFSESLELRDMTLGKRIFKSKTRGLHDAIGLSHVDSFSSVAGVPLFKSHRYELISVYNNTTTVDQDSMAVMLMFLSDKEFKKPDHFVTPVPLAQSFPPPLQADLSTELARKDNPVVAFNTDYGTLTFTLFSHVAPKTVQEILSLVQAGAYDTGHFYRLEKGFVLQTALVYDRTTPLTDAQRVLIHNVPLEPSTIRHVRGILSMARQDNDLNSGESSFSIMLGDGPQLDDKYTVFGFLTAGDDVLKKIESLDVAADNQPLQRLKILSARVIASASKK